MPNREAQNSSSAIKIICLLFAILGIIGSFSFNWDDVHGGGIIWAFLSMLLFFVSFLALLVQLLADRKK